MIMEFGNIFTRNLFKLELIKSFENKKNVPKVKSFNKKVTFLSLMASIVVPRAGIDAVRTILKRVKLFKYIIANHNFMFKMFIRYVSQLTYHGRC